MALSDLPVRVGPPNLTGKAADAPEPSLRLKSNIANVVQQLRSSFGGTVTTREHIAQVFADRAWPISIGVRY
jgi:hypothetical protein